MPEHFLVLLPKFLAYFAVASILLALFVVIYVNVTPYAEFALMRTNNTAAATSLSGTLIGFAIPVANVVAHSDTILDLIFWGVVAGIVQLLVYAVARLTLPKLAEDIPAGHMAPAIFLAALSITVGLLNAACMSY